MKNKNKVNQLMITIILCVLCILVIFPFVLLLSVSFSSEADIAEFGYSIIPKNFSLDAYKYIFTNASSVIQAYKVTTIFSLVTMVLATLLMALIAYPLSRRNFVGKKGISFYLYFTMLFNGGLVPTYILLTQYLKLADTIWIYILPSLISPWYVFMMRTFFQGLPDGIPESGRIDGASEWTIFFKLILPLSKPVLASVALFTFLSKWNDWMHSMLYINDQKLISLQYLLQRMLSEIDMLQQMSEAGGAGMIDVSKLPSETARMAMAIVVAGPALIIFPFFQKYFVKGITVGSVKG